MSLRLSNYMSKRHNPYCVEDVMVKHILTREAATKKIAALKQRTAGSLESFIRRYGDILGRERFETFSKKSAHTKDTFIRKYGDDWEKEWKNYRESKSSGRDKLIKKYGEEEGNRRFAETNKKRINSLSKEGLILKFGEEGYIEITKSKDAASINYFVSKYGLELGTLKHKELCHKKSVGNSLEGYIARNGVVEGRKMYDRIRVRASSIYNQLRKVYGEEEALIIYSRYKDKRDIVTDHKLVIRAPYSSKYTRLARSCCSQESTKFFKALEEGLCRKLSYGLKRNEHKIFDVKNNRTYYYDCLDLLTNTIIEFHGVAYHPRAGDVDWLSPFGRSYEEALKYDINKKDCAINNGFKFIVVYSDETRLKHNFDSKVRELVTILKHES